MPLGGRALSSSAAVWVAATGTLAALAGACQQVVAKYGGPAFTPTADGSDPSPMVTVAIASAPVDAGPLVDAGTLDGGPLGPATDASAPVDAGGSSTAEQDGAAAATPLADASRRRGRITLIRAASVAYGGRVSDAVIKRIVLQNWGRMHQCYRKALATAPTLAGHIVVRFVIGQDGTVSQVSAEGSPPSMHEKVAACVARSFYGLSFPKPKGGTMRVSYPFRFTPDAPP